jgi:glycosyltransferase involved in cell wall biosynthesis
MRPEQHPSVTVLMPLFNGEKYIRQAVESILVQTWPDFELLIIDDGSTDAGPEIVSALHDHRIVMLRNERNMGVAATLNRGLDVARGRLIARMDADDISLPDRLERQVRFMDGHPLVGISGGWVRLFGGGELPYTCRVPSDCDDVAAYMLFENSLWHVTAIMRKSAMIQASLQYDSNFSRSEDYDLWTRANSFYPLANIGHTLVQVRRHKGSVTRTNWDEMTRQTEVIQARLLASMGLHLSSNEIAFHHRVGRGYRLENLEEVYKAEKWLFTILSSNKSTSVYSNISLKRAVSEVWFRLCANSGPLGPRIWKKWRTSSLAATEIPAFERFRFIASILWHTIRGTRRRSR